MIKYTATREYLDKKRHNFRIAPMKLNSLSRFNEPEGETTNLFSDSYELIFRTEKRKPLKVPIFSLSLFVQTVLFILYISIFSFQMKVELKPSYNVYH